MAPCFEANHVRCCGVSSRSFIGMFGKADDGTATERANTEDELARMSGDSREQQSMNEEEATSSTIDPIPETDARQANQVTMVFPSQLENQASKGLTKGVEGLGIPVQVIYASEEEKNKSAERSSEFTKENIVEKELTVKESLQNEKHARKPTKMPHQLTTHSPSTNKTTVSTKSKDQRRRRFRPVTARARSQQTEILAEPEQSDKKTKVSNRPWAKTNQDIATSTVGPTLTTSIPVKSHRRRLFNAQNRLNYLRKKATEKQNTTPETVETVTESDMQTSDVMVPVPITILKKPISRVDKEHRFMIEQVRFMLAQDTRRYAMVPVHSAFSTMAVAGVVPKPVMEDDVETVMGIKETEPTTEQPAIVVTERTARPFRGRKRYRFAGLMTRSTHSPKIRQTKDSDFKQKASTLNPSNSIESNNADQEESESSAIRRHKYQRRTRRVNETNDEVTFPSAVPADDYSSAMWSEMFPPNWASEPINEDQYRSDNQTTEPDDVNNIVSAPTMNLPTFLQAWSQFLPPFWSTTPSTVESDDETIADDDTTVSEPDTPTLTSTKPLTASSWFPSSLLPSRFWSSSKPSEVTPIIQSSQRSASSNILQQKEEPTFQYEYNRKVVDGSDKPNFSGLVTLNENMQPLQIVGPIPKFNPPNDAGHIEFELPLETGEIVLV